MDSRVIRQIHRVTALVTFASAVFCEFFFINKGEPFRDINPFGEDPYDAIGSFAFQLALLIGILTYARALQLREAPMATGKTRLILRGNVVVLSAILITLIADAIAEIVRPFPPSHWGNVLAAELVLMFLLALFCAVALRVVFRGINSPQPATNLTPADGFDDLWTLVRVPLTTAGTLLPHPFVELVNRFNSDKLFSKVQWLNPRRHPWRFACTLGLLVGIAVYLIQLQEGTPPNLRIGLLVAAIFIFGEFAAIIVGFATLGSYLGLRPRLKKIV